MAKMMVGMSGGVDSAVAAWRLREAGHDVAGAYIKTWMHEAEPFGPCPWEVDAEDARASAERLGIPFTVVNLIGDYRERVVHYLVEGYRRGLTPNPDMMCNREMKFGVFADWARAQGYATVATGHYARNAAHADGSPAIALAADPNKDQTYFLALLSPAQVASAVFPLGDLRKPEVRELARRAGLPVAAKKDSQGVCFIGKVPMADFLAQFLPDQPGDIVTAEGRVVGEHRGLHRYTIGQRHGIGVPSNTDHRAYVVLARETSTNRLIVGFDEPTTPGLWTTTARLVGLTWQCPTPPNTSVELAVRVRYRDPLVASTFCPTGPSTAMLSFATAQRALAPGQICALYDGPRLLGGGVFT